MLRRVVGVVLFVQIVGAVSADTPSYRPSPGSAPPMPKVRTAYEAETCAPFDRMMAMARSGREGPGKPLFGTLQNPTTLNPPLFNNLNACKARANSEGGYSVTCSQVSDNADWPGQFQAYRDGTIKLCYPGWTRNKIGNYLSFISPDRALRWSIHRPDPKYYGNMVETTAAYEPNAVNSQDTLR
jgi:hypothetical protein